VLWGVLLVVGCECLCAFVDVWLRVCV
jgi:hypothetical protein